MNKNNIYMTQIIPSMLVLSEEEFKTQIESIRGEVEMVQIDLADGKFVPNTTWGYNNPGKAQEYLDINFELHLMVSDPLKTIEAWADNPKLKRILIHYESVDDMKKVISELKSLKKEISIVLNPDTPSKVLNPFLNQIQGVMFMGVNPGFQGQKFIPETLDRIKALKAKNTKHFIEVDGAVNENTLPNIIKAGADGVCPGSAIFGNKNTPAENIKKLKKLT